MVWILYNMIAFKYKDSMVFLRIVTSVTVWLIFNQSTQYICILCSMIDHQALNTVSTQKIPIEWADSKNNQKKVINGMWFTDKQQAYPVSET